MGGKRPDQYAIDPAETGPDERRTLDENLHAAEKQEYTESRADVEEHNSRIPKSGKNPALAELQAARERQAAEARGDDASSGE